MSLKVERSRKRRTAFAALYRRVGDVVDRQNVLLEMAALSEHPPAVLASKRSLARVHSHVSGQSRRNGEAFAAGRADVRVVVRVTERVLAQRGRRRERPLAPSALVRTYARV